ncbi:hypothetical protein F4604DRAFT_817056 [Suillus subluteus]|nr:hypothetical protein F4604DRAFT_817056 [Suillus subluteus]
MEYIFLSKIKDSGLLEDFLEGFTGSQSFAFIQNETINISWNERAQTRRVKATGPKIFMDFAIPQLREIVDRSISTERERFRMLCVGRPGSGKDVVLSKICGQEITLDRSGRKAGPADLQDDIAVVRTIPSTSIGEEITFTGNGLLVVHDVKPGHPNIQDDINSFIASRSQHQSVAEHVHVIWYFLAADQGELMEAQAFFSVPHELPVVVIFTGLDEFVKIELQKISDGESDVPQADEEETEGEDPEEQAMSRAMERFDARYKHGLMGMKYPPKEVVALSELRSERQPVLWVGCGDFGVSQSHQRGTER